MRVKLSEICEVTTGKSNVQDSVINGKYPFFDRSSIVKYSNEYLFDNETIIYAGEGTAFYPKYFKGKYNLHQRCYSLFNFKDIVNPKYLYYALFGYNSYFLKNTVGTTVPSLRRDAFLKLEIELPNKEIQDKIANILSCIDNQIERNNVMVQKLPTFRTTTYCISHKEGELRYAC